MAIQFELVPNGKAINVKLCSEQIEQFHVILTRTYKVLVSFDEILALE